MVIVTVVFYKTVEKVLYVLMMIVTTANLAEIMLIDMWMLVMTVVVMRLYIHE